MVSFKCCYGIFKKIHPRIYLMRNYARFPNHLERMNHHQLRGYVRARERMTKPSVTLRHVPRSASARRTADEEERDEARCLRLARGEMKPRRPRTKGFCSRGCFSFVPFPRPIATARDAASDDPHVCGIRRSAKISGTSPCGRRQKWEQTLTAVMRQLNRSEASTPVGHFSFSMDSFPFINHIWLNACTYHCDGL